MRARLRLGAHRDERGAFIVLWALLIVALLMMVATVLDLGQARNTGRFNQQIADFAALAAGNALETTGDGSQACRDAFATIRSNVDLPSGSPNCNPMSSNCRATTPARTVTFNSGEWAISLIHPVPDTDVDMNDARRADVQRDGDPCDRFKVRVQRTESTFFAGVAGFDELTTSGAAVAKSNVERQKEVPSLWLLDPNNCTSLNVSGGSTLRVGLAAGDPTIPGSVDTPGEPALSNPVGGFVTIDSDGTRCGGSRVTLDSDNSSQVRGTPLPPGEALPPPQSGVVTGAIRLWALNQGTTGCPTADDPSTPDKEEDHACQVSDLAGPISPTPSALDSRATRAPIDHRFNCHGSDEPYPDFHGVDLDDCDQSATRRPHIDDLRDAVGGPSYGAPEVPTGFVTLPAAGVMPSCNPGGAVVVPVGNYYIDCPTLSIGAGTTVTFTGGNLVLRGGLKLTGSGTLNVNTLNTETLLDSCRTVVCPTEHSAHAAYLYQRSGDLEMTGGVLNVNRTMVYQDNGSVKITGGSPPSWTAPKEAPLGGTYADLCSPSMPCSPFQGLALWSEKRSDYSISGGGALNLEGVFFTPEAVPFKLTGGGGFTPLRAQFIAFQLTISGGGSLRLVPDARQHVPQSRRAAILIR